MLVEQLVAFNRLAHNFKTTSISSVLRWFWLERFKKLGKTLLQQILDFISLVIWVTASTIKMASWTN